MNVIIYVILGGAAVALFLSLSKSLRQPDPLEEMTRSHRLARPGDEPVFLIRTEAKEKEVTEELVEPSVVGSQN
jgi:hypothetical protein